MITLAIIGVVAALTIPVVVAKYQKKQYYTQFMKVYNTISEALSMSSVDNGAYDTWGVRDKHEQEAMNSYILPYLKIQKVCDEDSDNCGLNSMKMYFLDGSESDITSEDFFYGYSTDPVLLTDGSIIVFDLESTNITKDIRISFDTNGTKGPNTYGRDLFEFGFYYLKINNNYKLVPEALLNYDKTEMLVTDGLMESIKESCSTEEEESMGNSCSARLLLEGKMDY